MALFKKAYYIFTCSLVLFFASCGNTKYLPANDALYTGAKIKIDSSSLSRKQKRNIKEDLAILARPKPNKKTLGLKLKLYAYNIAGNPKKQGSVRGLLKYKFGEPPVLASDVDLGRNAKVLQSYLQNKGYFQALVDGDSIMRSKKEKAIYHVQPGNQYTIQTVTFLKDSSAVNKAIAADFSETLLQKGKPFDLDIIKLERIRIDADLKENGYYFFNPDFLVVDVDSNLKSNKVDLFVKIKQGLPDEAQQSYDINAVYIFANYKLNGNAADTNKLNAVNYKKFYLVDSPHRFKPAMFEEAMRFRPGDTYTRSDHILTLSRLINLGVFKFVKNRFDVVQGTDSPLLNSYYYLTPMPKKSLHAEIYGTTKSDNLVGSQVTFGWRNRNTFKGGELFSIDLYGGFEVQFSSNLQGYNTYRTGLNNKLSFPRFLVPFFNLNTGGAFVPKTNIELGYDYLTKIRLYTLNSLHGSFGYDWKESARKDHTLNPIAITYVQPLNVTQEYKDSAVKNPVLLLAIQKQFILGSNYNFNYNQLVGKQPPNAIYFNGNLDLSGNIAGLLSGANAKGGKTIYLLGLDFSQYVRAETDFRYYHKEGTTVWANRIDIGFGYPYGNSTALPFIKQFF